jgi:hypothetical protein
MRNFTIQTSTCLHVQLQAYITFPMFPNAVYEFILQNSMLHKAIQDGFLELRELQTILV